MRILDDGREVVLWGTQDPGEEAQKPWVVRAAQRSPTQARFRSLGVLDPGGRPGRPESGVALVQSGRDVLASWVGVSGEFNAQRVRAARWRIGAARFDAPQTLSQAGRLNGLDVAPDGTVAISWSQFEPNLRGNIRADVAFRAPGAAAFGAPETIAEGEIGHVGLAFDPSGSSLVGMISQDGRVARTTRPTP